MNGAQEKKQIKCDQCKRVLFSDKYYKVIAAKIKKTEYVVNIRTTFYSKLKEVQWAFCDDCYYKARKKYWKTRIWLFILLLVPVFLFLLKIGHSIFLNVLGGLSGVFLIVLIIFMISDLINLGTSKEIRSITRMYCRKKVSRFDFDRFWDPDEFEFEFKSGRIQKI